MVNTTGIAALIPNGLIQKAHELEAFLWNDKQMWLLYLRPS